MPSIDHVQVGGSGKDCRKVSTSQTHELGTKMVYADGRVFRYAKAGASALAVGKLMQSEVPGANWDELVIPSAAAIGDKIITITNGATVITQDLFKEGFLTVEDDTGEGYSYKITANDAEPSGSAAFTVTLEEGIEVAFTTSTTVSIIKNPFDAVIIHPSPPTAQPLGVTVAVVAGGSYCWLQTGGRGVCLVDTTPVAGKLLMPSSNVDGAVMPYTAAGDDEIIVGRTIEVAADTEYGPLWLCLD